LFCFSGAFGIKAALNGAESVISVDIHEPSIDLGRKSSDANQVSHILDFQRFEAFEFLTSTDRKWDVIFLDPPSFVRGSRRARRNLNNYRKINSLALNCLAPDGILVTSCCSFHVKRHDFMQVIHDAMGHSNRRGRVFHSGSQSPDHPIIPGMDGTDYLKCFSLLFD
jgi:23S rRNA (cytosine1962-C5)-methyltransferase